MNTPIKDIRLRAMTADDWESVAHIYKQGIQTGNATFQQDIPSPAEWDAAHLKNCRIVAEKDGDVIGWAALTPVSGRCVYAGVAEVSVYIDPASRGKGVGNALLQALITESEANGLWTLQAGIFPENTASVQLHEKCGFRLIGTREKIGQMHGVWRDTVLLERRSKTIAI